MAKRTRSVVVPGFGAQLKAWRADREIETVARQVVHMGVPLDGNTIRMWEYGWIARPDPVPLLALARVYGVAFDDVVRLLAKDRAEPGAHMAIPREAGEPPATTLEGFSPVRWLRAPIAAGQPLAMEPDDELDSWLVFQDTWLKPYHNPLCLTVGRREHSMLPTILPGDVVVLDQALSRRAQPTSGAIYAVNLSALTNEEGGTLKRIEVTDGHLVIIADNSDKGQYASRAFDLADLELPRVLIGLVVWIGRNVIGKRART